MVFRKHKSTAHVEVVTGLVQLYDLDWVNFEYLTLTVDPLTSIWDIMLHTMMYPERTIWGIMTSIKLHIA
jgi:hypothetical protein